MQPLQPIFNAAIPFVDDIIGGLKPGMIITLNGFAPSSASYFLINLALGKNYVDDTTRSPIAFHASVRFHQGYVARNIFQNGWGKEEGSKSDEVFPFVRGQRFEIMILVTKVDYKLSVNGKHYISFSHRIPFQDVTTLQILPDVIIEKILITHACDDRPKKPLQINSSSNGILYNLAVPFEIPIPQGCQIGRTVYLTGRPTARSKSFNINFYGGNGEEIAFHLSIRFGDRVVVRNTYVNRCWDKEERAAISFPFVKTEIFDLKICCERTGYVVFVNGQHFCHFRHRLNFDQVDKFQVIGEVVIISLIFT